MDPETKPLRSGGSEPPRPMGVDLMDNKPPKHRMIPVWFFIGVILLIYGIMILASGLYELSRPPSTVLGELHAPIWWGAILAVVGAFYTYSFRPTRGS